MRRFRRALVLAATLGLTAFLAVVVRPAFAGTVSIPPSDLNGVEPGDVRLGTTPPGNPARTGIAYHVFHWYDDGCVDSDSDTVRRNGGKVQLFDCNSSVFQQWFFDPTGVDGLFRIRTVYRPDGCLDADSSVPAGGRVQVWQCLGTDHHNQLWWLVLDRPDASDPWHHQSPLSQTRFVSDWNGQCMQVGRGEGYDLVLSDCDASAGWRQSWWPLEVTRGTPPWPVLAGP